MALSKPNSAIVKLNQSKPKSQTGTTQTLGDLELHKTHKKNIPHALTVSIKGK